MEHMIMKWLIKLDDMDQIVITDRVVSKHAPINRILDEVGFFSYESTRIQGITYLVVFKPEEANTKKSIILVSKTEKYEDGGRIVDLIDEDRLNMELLADQFLRDVNHQMN